MPCGRDELYACHFGRVKEVYKKGLTYPIVTSEELKKRMTRR